jgi:hypothetical protein
VPGLLSVDSVAFSARQIADGHAVCLASTFDTAFTGGGQVVVPVGTDGCSTPGCEDEDDVGVAAAGGFARWEANFGCLEGAL